MLVNKHALFSLQKQNRDSKSTTHTLRVRSQSVCVYVYTW